MKPKRPITGRDVLFGGLIVPLLGVGVFVGLDRFVHSTVVVPFPISMVGIGHAAIGGGLGIWCLRTIPSIPELPILVNWGPWAHVRHPIYVSGLLVDLGVTFLIGTLIVLVGFVVYALFEILADVLVEERGLLRRFGAEYGVYKRAVPGWVPRLRRGR